MRITRHALLLAFPLLLAGCKGTERIQGTPSNLTEFRTLASMQPYITTSLTARKAKEQFGTPNSQTTIGEIVLVYNVEDSQTTSGEIVLVYNVEDSQKVTLGFPSLEGQINYASLSDKTGASTNLQILP